MSVNTEIRTEPILTTVENPDQARAAALFTLRELYHSKDPDQKEIKWMLDQMEDRVATVTALAGNGDILAVAGLVKTVRPSEAIVVGVATDSAHRELGLGKKVMQSVEEIAQKDGISHIDLFPLGSAVGFYEKLGYHRDQYRHTKAI